MRGAGNPCVDVMKVDLQRVGIHFAEQRPEAGRQDGLYGGGKREGWHNDATASGQVERLECQVERGGAAAHGHHVGGAESLPEGVLERSGHVALAEPSGVEHPADRGEFFLAEGGTVRGNETWHETTRRRLPECPEYSNVPPPVHLASTQVPAGAKTRVGLRMGTPQLRNLPDGVRYSCQPATEGS